MNRPSVFVVFLTVFLDLVGFGIVLPLLPIYSREFGAGGWMIGAIIASFSLMQFVFAPLWGRWSDRVGRRPVLLISIAGSAVSYALFAVGSGLDDSTALVVLLVSRVFAGVCGANITVAQAYVADITPPEQRSKRMGLIGMAFGLGFIFGPALGGQANHWLGMTGPGWVAAGMCAANFLLALAILPESLRPDSVHAAVRPARAQWAQNLAHPQIGLLTAVFFVATFCFACFETTIGLLVSENFNLRVRDDEHAAMKVSNLFVYCGLIGALVQGGAIGRLVRLMGEARLITLSFLLVALSLASLPFVKEWGLLLVVLGVLSIGSSLTRPPLFGLISNLAPAHEQGATLGVAQSAGSLARIPSPVFAATLFDRSHAWPYLACAALLLLVMGLTWRRLRAAEAVSKR